MSIKFFAFSLLALAAGVTATQAQTTVLDNLSSVAGNTIKGSSTGTTISQAFVTGGAATVLADVMFPQILQGPTSGTYLNNYSATETFSLYSTNPATGLPFNSLVSLTVAPGSGSSTMASSNASGDQTIATVPGDALSQAGAILLPNTKYWLVLNGGTNISWDYTLSTSAVDYGSGFSLPATGVSSQVTSSSASTNYTLAGGPQEIYLSVVPEPSAYYLMAVAGLALVVGRKRSIKVA